MVANNRKRYKQIKFCVTESEHKKIKDKVVKSKLTQTEYLIKSALDKKIVIIEGLKEIIVELSREGNNLNQIARKLNEGKEVSLLEIKEMKNKLIDLWDKIYIAVKGD